MGEVSERLTKYSISQLAQVRSLLWFLFCRALIASLFFGGTVYFSSSLIPSTSFQIDARLVFIIALTFLQICFSLFWILKGTKYLDSFVQFQIVWDLALCTATAYVTGGINSQFAFLYIFVILASGLFCNRTEVFLTSAAAIILYGGLVNLQFYGFISVSSLPLTSPVASQQVLYRLYVNLAAFLLTGLLSGILSTRLCRSQQLLERERSEFIELEHLSRLILKNIPSGLMVVDLHDGVRSFNESASAISGIESGTALSLTVQDLFSELDLSCVDLPVEREELCYRHPDGSARIIGYSASPVHDSGGELYGTLIAFQDLTQIKKMEQELQLKDRLSAIGGLAAGLAHEIRNPLASLSGSVDLMKEHIAFSSSDKQLMDIVSRETSRLNKLLTDFLVFARPREPQYRRNNISAIIDDVVALARTDADFEAIEIGWSHDDELWGDVDAEMMHQVVWNLLKNAAKFVGEPGFIGVSVSVANHCFWVDDNGPGVEKSLREKIFEPFYSTRAEGTGLGLAIVHSIITAHKGTIECTTSPAGGARMTVHLTGSNDLKGKE